MYNRKSLQTCPFWLRELLSSYLAHDVHTCAVRLALSVSPRMFTTTPFYVISKLSLNKKKLTHQERAYLTKCCEHTTSGLSYSASNEPNIAPMPLSQTSSYHAVSLYSQAAEPHVICDCTLQLSERLASETPSIEQR